MYQGIAPNADPLFKRDLMEFDSDLRVEFNRAAERFVITKPRPFGNPWVVLVVESDSGDFKPPDRRDIAKLWLGDLWRHGGPDARVRTGEEKMVEARQKSEQQAETEIKDHTRDDGRYLRKQWRAIANDGKANSDVRRIDVKPKGKTIQEIQKTT
jgi:hypothetical protein